MEQTDLRTASDRKAARRRRDIRTVKLTILGIAIMLAYGVIDTVRAQRGRSYLVPEIVSTTTINTTNVNTTNLTTTNISTTNITEITQIVFEDGGNMGGGNGKGRIKYDDEAVDTMSVRTAYLRLQLQEDDFAIVNTTLLGRMDFFGDDDTASADEVAGQIDVTATGTWTDGAEDGRMELSVSDDGVLNNDQLVLNTDGTVTTSGSLNPTDLEIPQATPAVPATDGAVEIDFTDGKLVVQHGSAHAELASATDVAIGTLIKSWSGTLAMPDGLQAEIDNWSFKAIESTEFPHGVVITAIHLKTSASSTYAVNVENWSDPTTIDGSNPTIDAITTSGSTEATETTITYSTMAPGSIIMLDLPTTDIGWITVQIEYYEPAA